MTDEIQTSGIVSGGSIFLDHPLQLSDGQRIVIAVRPVDEPVRGEGIRASAGAWSDAGPSLDGWLAEVYDSRRSTRGNLAE